MELAHLYSQYMLYISGEYSYKAAYLKFHNHINILYL